MVPGGVVVPVGYDTRGGRGRFDLSSGPPPPDSQYTSAPPPAGGGFDLSSGPPQSGSGNQYTSTHPPAGRGGLLADFEHNFEKSSGRGGRGGLDTSPTSSLFSAGRGGHGQGSTADTSYEGIPPDHAERQMAAGVASGLAQEGYLI